VPADHQAVQSPFLRRNGESSLQISLDASGFTGFVFVLFFPDEGRWDNNHGRNYHIPFPDQGALGRSLEDVLRERVGSGQVEFERLYDLERNGKLAVALAKQHDRRRVAIVTDIAGPLRLHWGVTGRSRSEWLLPPPAMRPPGTVIFQDVAAQTPFDYSDGFGRLELPVNTGENLQGIAFVLLQENQGRWLKDRGSDFYVPLSAAESTAASEPRLEELAGEIIENEMGRNSWTLMHRFNLCYDLLDKAGNRMDELALLYVWLRFSAVRQLDWQRNYNTKPRELSHAMDRLTRKLASLCAHEPAVREIVRLMMTTTGRGGEGQRIRDEILEIMHRHHIKEISGQFMEEWHQKMHNNTTPDDIVICEAYLEFLRSDGDLHRYYATLEAGGVTRARLEGFERPVKTPPDFLPHLKEALIHDFEHFLGTLKSIHSATDLGIAIQAAGNQADDQMQGLLSFIWNHRNDSGAGVTTLVEKITEVRRRLSPCLNHNGELRDLLFLDIALEDFLRVAVERNLHSGFSRDEVALLLRLVLHNFRMAHEDEEIRVCSDHWDRLMDRPPFDLGWALHAESVLDRLERAVGAYVDRFHSLLQPKAGRLGKAFHAAPWTISIFSEEVMRGGPAFVPAVLVRSLRAGLREATGAGQWHVVSRGAGVMQLKAVDKLAAVQGKHFDVPTAILAGEVKGNEEIADGVRAVLTPAGFDMLSHVAIRARNARILLATCYDPRTIQHLKSLDGQFMELAARASGEVVFEAKPAGVPGTRLQPHQPRGELKKPGRPQPAADALASKEFNERAVGGKSLNLARLDGRLPDWIHLPPSAALPFGAFEKVLDETRNRAVREHYESLLNRLEDDPPEVLRQIREVLLDLEAPDEMASSLHHVMEESGLGRLDDWPGAWTCIKQVWASKWNERAYWARKNRGIEHEDLFMAVLIQRIVKADYAFVIHTVHPLSGNRDELYGEVVLGLGEALVGNYPGRGLSFTCGKTRQVQPQMISYPSKSIGLYGGGVIFRSDSSGEDLPGYAGAGLYDSVVLPPPQTARLDYSCEPLLWDEAFRKQLLTGICRLGVIVEGLMGGPQDIEGACAGGRYHLIQARPQVGINEE
jgi:alpha-glucan,water dikinase